MHEPMVPRLPGKPATGPLPLSVNSLLSTNGSSSTSLAVMVTAPMLSLYCTLAVPRLILIVGASLTGSMVISTVTVSLDKPPSEVKKVKLSTPKKLGFGA